MLLCLKKICSGVEWEGKVSDQQSQTEEAQRDSILVWGHKKARTARYEVPFQEAIEEVESSKSEAKCKICRSNCPHWSSLDKREKNKAYVMFYRKKQNKEQRQIRLANQSRFQRKYYANLSQVEKDKRKKAAVQNRREKIANMTPEQRKAFYRKNRGKA